MLVNCSGHYRHSSSVGLVVIVIVAAVPVVVPGNVPGFDDIIVFCFAVTRKK